MHIAKPFKITDKDEIHRFIHHHGFAQLTVQTDTGLLAAHIPLQLSECRTKLLGHLAKANPMSQCLDQQPVLASFLGPHDYISPTWYHSPGVPTWNYQAVHVYGDSQTTNAPDALKNIVDKLSKQYESETTGWSGEFPPGMLSAITGIEIDIKEYQCAYKLSQNRSKQDRESVIQQLEQKGSTDLSAAMATINPK